MKIAIKCYNNQDWLGDTDFMILNIDKEFIKELKKLSDKLTTSFKDYDTEIKFYNKDFQVYSNTTENLSIELEEFIDSNDEFKILNDNGFSYEDLKTSEFYNDVKLDTYMLVLGKNYFFLKCYGKHDGSIEVYSNDINLNVFQI